MSPGVLQDGKFFDQQNAALCSCDFCGHSLAGATPRLSRAPVHRDCQHAATRALTMGIWKEIHLSWGKSAVNLHFCSPILVISLSRTPRSKLSTRALGMMERVAMTLKQHFPVSKAPGNGCSPAEAREKTDAEKKISLIFLILYGMFSRSMNHSIIWSKRSHRQLSVPGCCCRRHKARKFLDLGCDILIWKIIF